MAAEPLGGAARLVTREELPYEGEPSAETDPGRVLQRLLHNRSTRVGRRGFRISRLALCYYQGGATRRPVQVLLFAALVRRGNDCHLSALPFMRRRVTLALLVA